MARRTCLGFYRVLIWHIPIELGDMPPAKCDYTRNITSFPLVFTGTPTAELYNSVIQPYSIEFQWASRSVSPSFLTGTVKNIIDESSIYGSGLSNISTIRYNNTLYNLYSVQICSASHKSWLLPSSNKDNNTEDLVITFYNPSLTRSYVIIVLPIIKNGTVARDPAYLTALGSGQTPGTFSLGSCMPDKKSLFIYYSAKIQKKRTYCPLFYNNKLLFPLTSSKRAISPSLFLTLSNHSLDLILTIQT